MNEANAERVIDTPRLALEPQCAAHAEAMFVVLGDPAIYQFENTPPRSLERLGFAPATAAECARAAVENDEVLMQRSLAAIVPTR